MTRKEHLFDIIEVGKKDTTLARAYDIVMVLVIVVSFFPLMVKGRMSGAWSLFEWVPFAIFVMDYLIRWYTADLYLKKGIASYYYYPFTRWAILDLLCILPYISLMSGGFVLLKLLRLFRFLLLLKIIKYSTNMQLMLKVFKKQRDALLAVILLAIGYILVTSILIFNVEPDTFDTFFDAIYWGTVSLTTVGYGDIYATSVIGKVVTMLSAFVGVGIVALPAGILTAGYMEELTISREKRHHSRHR
ncbi:potassium channel family protein [Streptococcus fryi]